MTTSLGSLGLLGVERHRKHKNKETVQNKVFGKGDKVGKGWAVAFILKVKHSRVH